MSQSQASTLPRRRTGLALAFALPAIAALALLQHGPIAQPGHYHDFADARPWLGIPHAANVLTNLPFLLAGLLGWRAAGRMPADAPPRAAWRLFFAGVALTTVGSSIYHWSPDNAGLMLDRLPIALACAALSCALLCERCASGFGRPAVLAGATVAAVGSVLAWYGSELAGRGDLRFYLWVQFLPILLLPLVAQPARAGLVPGDWLAAFGLYAVAKACEIGDAPLMEMTGLVSGHSLKHLVAGAAALWLALALGRAAASGAAPVRQAAG